MNRTTQFKTQLKNKLSAIERYLAARKVIRSLVLVAGLLLVVAFWGIALEARRIATTPISSWTDDVNVDCAIVLTGGPIRIREGVDLLSRGSVQKLIISGVHPSATFHEIFPLWPFYSHVRDQDVVLERRSRTTYGNAQQSLPLVEALHCRDVALVTSRIHMRRALATFRAVFPATIPIQPRAVISGASVPNWSDTLTETAKSIFYASWAY